MQDCGAEDNCYAVAQSPCETCWGVGIAAGSTNRIVVAKFALALAMASTLDRLGDLAKLYPEIEAICKDAAWIGDAIDKTASPVAEGTSGSVLGVARVESF